MKYKIIDRDLRVDETIEKELNKLPDLYDTPEEAEEAIKKFNRMIVEITNNPDAAHALHVVAVPSEEEKQNLPVQVEQTIIQ